MSIKLCIPNDIIGKILSLSDVSIDTYLEFKKEYPIKRTKKVYISPQLQKKLDIIYNRRKVYHKFYPNDIYDVCVTSFSNDDFTRYKGVHFVIRNNIEKNITQIEFDIHDVNSYHTKYAYDIHTGEISYISTIP